MKTVVIPPPDTPVAERLSSVVVYREKDGSWTATPQGVGKTFIVSRATGGGSGGALLAVNRLSEFDTEQKKADVRANIGLAVIDGGTFF